MILSDEDKELLEQIKKNDAGESTSATTEETLVQRGSRYGTFEQHSTLSQELKNCIFTHATKHACSPLLPYQVEAIEMICHKLARIANGDPNYDDSWRDIAGYAELVVKQLNNEGL